ncbi:MAG: bile acid:sodium symporter [Chloroflexota bacterium]|jgi:predicted Na+-dependent transporter
MTIADLIGLIAGLSGLLFVVTSMLAMGSSLTMAMILQPLKNTKLVLLALVANFILVPALAYVITLLLPISEDQKIGLIVLACAAGAPFLPKLAQNAKGSLGFSVGLMVLLMVVTVIYMPIVMPLLLQGVSVNPWDIAQSLIVLMLIPLAIGLFIRSHSVEDGDKWSQLMNKISTVGLLVMMVTSLALNISNIIDFIGSWGLLALVLFLVGSLIIGVLLGGRDPGIRAVMGLGTAQRNIAAAIVVVTQNFAGTDTLPFTLVAAILGLLILMPAAKRMGAKQEAPSAPSAAPQI